MNWMMPQEAHSWKSSGLNVSRVEVPAQRMSYGMLLGLRLLIEKIKRKSECLMTCAMQSSVPWCVRHYSWEMLQDSTFHLEESWHIFLEESPGEILKGRTQFKALNPAFPKPISFSIQKVFIEHWLCPRHCSSSGDWTGNATQRNALPQQADIITGETLQAK